MKITLKNKFHNTRVVVHIQDSQIKFSGPLDARGDFVLSFEQSKRVIDALCGVRGCKCDLADSDEYTVREERSYINPSRQYLVLEKKVRS